MKVVTIEIPDNMELVKTESEYELKEVEKEKEWEEFGDVKGWVISMEGEIAKSNISSCDEGSFGVYPTKAQAEASIYLAQLLNWRARIVKDEDIRWADRTQEKYCVGISYLVAHNGEPCVDRLFTTRQPLSFLTRSDTEQFIKDHKATIMKAKELV